MNPPRLALVFCLALSTMGCTMGQGMKTAMRTEGQSVLAESSGDPWVDGAGEYTRKIHPPEDVKDPLHLRELFRDEKARDIERNLGVGN